MWVLSYVIGVVIIDELITEDRPIDRKGDDSEAEANENDSRIPRLFPQRLHTISSHANFIPIAVLGIHNSDG